MRTPALPRARRALRCPAPLLRALLMLLALLTTALAAGCSSDPGRGDPAGAQGRPGPVGAAATSSPSAELQAGLTALLVERTHLVAATTTAVVDADGRLSDPGPMASLRALDDASSALADVLGATYSDAREPLLGALRRDDALLARHAQALATGDAASAEQVRAELDQATAELAAVVRRVVPALDAAELAERLRADLEVQVAVTGPDPWVALRAASAEAARTARLLASGIADDRRLGNPGTGAGRLRADAAALLTEHAALATAVAREQGRGMPVEPPAAALQANAEELADLVGEAYPAMRAPFFRAWTAHLDRLRTYGAARAEGVDPGTGLLRGFPDELGRLLAEHVGGLPARTVTTELTPAVGALLEAVGTAASGQVRAPAALRVAVDEAQPAAALVAAGIAEDLRLR